MAEEDQQKMQTEDVETAATGEDASMIDETGACQLGSTKMKEHNTLTIWGNKDTMNLNHLVLENILQSPYLRNKLNTLKTFHELVDEIYYNVTHLEPWEKGTRKTTGQTGMCGGVRGVGAGGVVSTPFCLLYRLFTLKLTRKQLYSLINHADSPFIRGLGFMYIRFCLHPNTFWDWYQPYLEDEEQIDPKAGSGDPMTIGQMVKIFLTKLEWYCTLFPRIPVPVQKDLDVKMRDHNKQVYAQLVQQKEDESEGVEKRPEDDIGGPRSRSRGHSRQRSRSADRRNRDDQRRKRSRSRSGSRRQHKRNRSRSTDHQKGHSSSSAARSGSKSRPRRSRSRSRDRRRYDDYGGRHHGSSHKHGKHDRDHGGHRDRGSKSRDDRKSDRGAGSSNRDKYASKRYSPAEEESENGNNRSTTKMPKNLNDTEEEGELRDDSRS